MLINKNTVTKEDREAIEQVIEQTTKERNCSRQQAVAYIYTREQQASDGVKS